MSEPTLTMASVSIDADPRTFANQLYRQLLAPLLRAYAEAQRDPLNAYVAALCSLSGCFTGSLAAATTPEYAAQLLRAAADSCDELPAEPPPHPAAETARPH